MFSNSPQLKRNFKKVVSNFCGFVAKQWNKTAFMSLYNEINIKTQAETTQERH